MEVIETWGMNVGMDYTSSCLNDWIGRLPMTENVHKVESIDPVSLRHMDLYVRPSWYQAFIVVVNIKMDTLWLGLGIEITWLGLQKDHGFG